MDNLGSHWNLLLRAVVFAYAGAALLFLVTMTLEVRILDRAGIWVSRVAFFLHTVLLALRWKAGGLGHPPWISPFEALLFFSWTTVGAKFFVLLREKISDERTGSVFGIVTLAGGLLGLAVLSPNQSIEVLAPMFRTPSLWVHGLAAGLAFGWLSCGALTAIFHWLSNDVRTDSVQAIFSLIVTISIGIFERAALQAGDLLPWFLVVFFLTHFILASCWVLLRDPPSVRGRSARAWYEIIVDLEERGELGTFLIRLVYLDAQFLLLLAAITLGTASGTGAHRRALLWILLFCGIFTALLCRFRSNASCKAASSSDLERMAYRMILQGVPLQLITLLSGGIWGFLVWGTYWNWDPKQIWALITTLFYSIFLHQKSQVRAKPSEFVGWAILGLLAALFAFQGVPLLLSSMHTFAGGA